MNGCTECVSDAVKNGDHNIVMHGSQHRSLNGSYVVSVSFKCVPEMDLAMKTGRCPDEIGDKFKLYHKNLVKYVQSG
jgi:hypothetical protein